MLGESFQQRSGTQPLSWILAEAGVEQAHCVVQATEGASVEAVQ